MNYDQFEKCMIKLSDEFKKVGISCACMPSLPEVMHTVNQFNLAAIKFSVLKVLNIRHL